MELGSNLQIDVRGVMAGQAINNSFNYIVETYTAGGTNDAVLAFQQAWRDEILPLVSAQYQVLAYVGAEIEGFVPYLHSGFYRIATRYKGAFEEEGDPDDDDGVLATDPLPTYAAVSVRKICAGLTNFEEDPMPLEKRIRGGFRISGIVEAQTKAASGNELEDATLTAFEDAMVNLRTVSGAGFSMKMEVVSLYKDTLARVAIVEGNAVAQPGRATVTSMTVSPYVSSQVSRKQTVARLG